MAMDGVMNFLTCFEEKLADEVPASMMTKILRIAADTLADFEIVQISQAEKGDDDLLKYYASVMGIQGRSQKTIDRYQYVIRRMLDTVKMPTRKITVYHLRSYLASEKERGIADSTLEGYREVFSAYYSWLQKESMIDKNPTVNLGKIKIPKKQKELLTDVDMEKLHRACNSIRDRAIIAFLDSTACRISEMTELNIKQVNFDKKELIVHGKGDKERPVILTDVAAMLLKEYLASRKDDSEALFVSERGAARLQPNGVRAMLNNVAKKAGVEHVHPHKFRRSKATRLAKYGTELPIIQKYLGHEKPETTLEYVMYSEKQITDAIRRAG